MKLLVSRATAGGLGAAALSYVSVDYVRQISPAWHLRLQPALWSLLSLIVICRIPRYKHWSSEFRAVVPFLLSMLFMLACLLFEALSVRFVTAVLGLDWHRDARPLPDIGQWLLLALNEKLPESVVNMLRAPVVGLHHHLMLFMMLAFSVLFNSIRPPGLGLGARYMFTMAIGRLLRAITFVSTILPSARPWCAAARFDIPAYPHSWAQKYYLPYASDANAIRQLIYMDMAYVEGKPYLDDYCPNWGSMSFLIDFLRPTTRRGESSSWHSLLKKAGGGCNDLLYSGHMFVAVLTAMAWMEAYGGFSSVFIWLLVLHSAQREVRERHHYTVDCIVAIYAGFLLWKMTAYIWPGKDGTMDRNRLEKIHGSLLLAAKEGDMDRVRELLKEVEFSDPVSHKSIQPKSMWFFSCFTIFMALIVALLAFLLTSDG